MKLKYYLRGLGIGMAVTALILGISFSGRQGQEAQTLTDEQIRERASELGMVDSSELTLAALASSAAQTPEATIEPEAAAEPEMTTEPEATEAPELITAPEQSQTTITIKKGSDSGSVSRQLYEAGLVENAKAFDNYLCNNGYSRSISPGI